MLVKEVIEPEEELDPRCESVRNVRIEECIGVESDWG